MTFDDAVRILDDRIPTRMVPDLDRMRALSELLAQPQRTYPSIHITGTNGKTTTAAVATELLRALGLSVGTYTSPHLHTVRERITYDGEPISAADFAETMAYLQPYLAEVDAGGERVTYFETLTMMAEVWFAEKAVDVAVMEVGMGGEWDATNLVDGRVAVITEVALDHPELGATPVEIAGEKRGIIKDGAICITGARSPEVLAAIADRCRDAGATLRRIDEDLSIAGRRLAFGGQALDLRVGDRRYDEVLVPLFGERMATDALLGVAAVSAFAGDRSLDEDVLREAMANLRSPGRVEVLRRRPLVIVDGAHNPDAATALRSAVEESFTWNRLILVIGMLADKDIAGVARILTPLADIVLATKPSSTRAASAEQLAKEIGVIAPDVQTVATVEGALGRALELAAEDDCVLVAGSFTTAAAARATVLGLS